MNTAYAIPNENGIYPRGQCEHIVYKKGNGDARVELARVSESEWTYGLHVSLSAGGFGYGAGKNGSRFPTRDTALLEAGKEIRAWGEQQIKHYVRTVSGRMEMQEVIRWTFQFQQPSLF